jgi:hypothetical protein
MTRFPAAVVIDFDAVRDRKLNELTGRALQLPPDRRLMVIVAMCQLLRDARRTRPAVVADALRTCNRSTIRVPVPAQPCVPGTAPTKT